MYTYLRRSERRAVISELLFSKPSAFLFATVRFSSVHLWTVTSITLSSNATNALKALVALILLVVAPMVCGQTVFAQTRESDPGPQASAQQTPEGKARSTEGTVRNPYYNSRQSLQEIEKASRINQQYVSGANAPRGVWGQFGAVDRILTGEQTNVVFQAAEQGKSGDVQRIARNSLNASLGAINSTYTGLHKWYADDIIGNLFTNIGQLAGKWLSELINGWIADTVQYLAQFLRIFVLNPNIAVNGLDGKMNDGISPYIRKGADTMYGIAVDLLLLLFILCIWKHWADASWKGAGNLMAPVGRLIFTAGLLLAWPTICAFEVQITNEMIKAVYFNSNDELARLHFALAITVKGGLIAAGAGALSVFAPIIGAGAAGSAAPFVSSGFYFASIVVFVILGGVLIAELVYLLVLKAIQTALLVAQYMFGPIFLVFFATPSTENIATGYVRSFVETSLWTFVWVGLLKIMVIIIYSNFNPWGKILIAIGILQMMIQVPSFLARAQISPMSDFVSAGLVTGGLTKAMSAVGGLLTTGISTLIGKAIDEKMLQGMLGTTESIQNNLGMPAKAPELTNSLDNASKTERERHGGVGANPLSLSSATGQTGGSPPAKKPTTASAIPSTKMPELTGVAGDESALTKPPSKPDASLDPAGNLGDQDANIEPLSFKPGDKPDAPPAVSQTVAEGKPLTSAPTSPSSPVSSSPVARTKEPADKSGGDSSGLAQPDQYKWKNSDVSGWDESNLVHVPVRKLIGKLTSVDGVGIRKGGKESSVLGTADHGVQRINVAANADDGETARIIYTAAYADMVAHDDPARDAARRAAFTAGAHQPQGFKESLIANWMEANGKSWYSTPWAKQNFSRAVMNAAVNGSAAFVTGDKSRANAYTDYLQGRFGEWDTEREAMAIHYMSNPESSESPWNRNIGPATESLIQSGIPISPGARGAMQNMAIQGMHPARRKQAVFAMLSYCFPEAKALYGAGGIDHNPVFDLGLGEMCRALPAEEVNTALAMYQVSGQADLKPEYAGYVTQLAADTGRDIPLAYASLATAAPHVARQLGRVKSSANIGAMRTISDLDAEIQPANGETKEDALRVVMQTTSSVLKGGEMHGIPMRTVMDPQVSSSIYEFMGSDVVNINSPAAHRKMQIVSRNLSTPGTPNDTGTLNALYSYVQSGGSMQHLDADHINVAANLVGGGVSGRVLPHAVEVAIQGGFYAAGGPMPIAEIEGIAQHYASGQVTDYRYVPIVSQMSGAGVQGISNQTIRIASEAVADNGGQFNAEHVSAVIRVSQGLRNANLAPNIVETFVRAQGMHDNIVDAQSMPLNQLMEQLETRGHGVGSVAANIGSIQRAGGFSDQNLQDSAAVQLMVDSQPTASPHTMQAINVVTRVIGADTALGHPEFITVTQEYLSNGGGARDLDLRPIHALRDLDTQRQLVENQVQQMPQLDPGRAQLVQKLSRFRLDSETLSTVTQDPSYKTGRGVEAALWNKVFM